MGIRTLKNWYVNVDFRSGESINIDSQCEPEVVEIGGVGFIKITTEDECSYIAIERVILFKIGFIAE